MEKSALVKRVLEGERCSDRLELERDRGKAGLTRDVAELGLGPRIDRIVIVDEVDRAAHHDVLDRRAGEGFGFGLKVAQEADENVLETDVAPPNGGLLGDEIGAENGFERTHQPPGIATGVGARSGAAIDGRIAVGWIKDRARDGGVMVFDGHENGFAVAYDGDGRVGRAKIDAADCFHGGLREHRN
jgi:hypothetical protein